MIGAVMLMIVYYIDNNCKPENGEPVVGYIYMVAIALQTYY